MNESKDRGYCIVVSDDEMNAALTELYIKQGRYNLIDGMVYCSMTGKFICRYEKPVEREEFTF